MRATSHFDTNQLCWQKLASLPSIMLRNEGAEILARSLQLDLISCRPYSPSPPSQTALVRRSRASPPKAQEWHLALTMLLHQWPGFLGLVNELNPHVETPGGGIGCTSVACCSFNLLPTLWHAVAGRFVRRVRTSKHKVETHMLSQVLPTLSLAMSNPFPSQLPQAQANSPEFHACPQSAAADAPTVTRGPSQNAFAQLCRACP